MAKLTRYTVGHMRELYASGLYHKADLAVRFIAYLKNIEEVSDVLSYKLFPEVRKDLQFKIFGIPYIQEAAAEYHKSLIIAANEEFQNVQSVGHKAPATFPEEHRKAESVLKDKVKFCNREFGYNFNLNDAKRRIFRGF